ncbi:MAG: cytochrome c-554 [bacterium]|nr:MAG: cytochrome c-554 [bacterium]
MKATFLVLTAGLFLLAGPPKEAAAAPRDAALYTGVKTCGMCHKKPESGNQLAIWTASPHAKAFEILATDAAKAVATKLGIEDAQKSGKCLQCHSTAYNFTEAVATEKILPTDGVTCESCHGPGKGYMSKAVMIDRTKAIAAGMIYPSSESCTLCHNDKSPTWNAEKYTLKDGKKVGFDYEQAYEKIKHPDPLVKHDK